MKITESLYIRFIPSLLCLFILSSVSPAQNNNEAFRVMTYNIRLDTPDDGLNRWDNRKDMVVSMINFYNADIVGTQEVLKNQKEYLDNNLGDFTSVGVGREDGIDKGEFSAIYFRESRFELVNNGTFWLSDTPEIVGSVGWDAALERISTWAKLKDKITGKEFFIFNTHFDHKGYQARIKSGELLISKMKAISLGLPVILTGDFNITNDNEAYNTIIDNSDFKMSDTQLISSEPHHGPSWSFHGFEDVPVNKRVKIDYIFVSDKITVLKHGILSDRFDDGYPSDHLPVLVEISLPECK